MEFWLANLRLPSSQWNLARSKRRYSIHGAADIRSPNGSGNNVNASQVGTSTPTCNVSVVPNSGSWSLLQLKFLPGILSWSPCSHIPVDNHHEAWVKLTLVPPNAGVVLDLIDQEEGNLTNLPERQQDYANEFITGRKKYVLLQVMIGVFCLVLIRLIVQTSHHSK